MKKVIVTGANGQLGQDVVLLLEEKGEYQVIPLKKEELNILDEEAVRSSFQTIRPDWILHCAAYTNVEAAEDDGKELNWKVNRDGARNVSKAAADVNAKMIYISTDYVFDGTIAKQYETDDATNPINQYGAAKLAGEKAVLEHLPCAHIVRTSWVFGEKGHNFVYTMLKLSKKMDTLKVVDDQYGRPTYARDLASFMLYIMEKDVPGGIYHFSNDGEATWFRFAKSILKNEDVQIIPVESTEFVQKAKRPKYSVMSLEKVKQTGFIIPAWEDALERFMKNINVSKVD
ncbi:dTDP-4-dehydrorhamnose reductase [Neobacillus drentensis]|uniref:dTDP-4-dehydrorhamnose reductase n=1 Tax=Neobacillus drentensis TaxID=220684 RepID=UPI0028654AF7|nr:dTDP-4-dehydrorhamnose reductase [Neobacillus drentensis]MDR7240692.1 dTDP-4-dehydrorhamnose reductase [Neobacillus drentensis]